jgi:hypothetical protein
MDWLYQELCESVTPMRYTATKLKEILNAEDFFLVMGH